MITIGLKKKIPNFLTNIRVFLALIVNVLLILDLDFGSWQLSSFFLNIKTGQEVYKYSIDGINYTFNSLHIAASIIFLIAVISDFLDGYLSRKWKVISDYGKIMDPWADKILVNGVLLILSLSGRIFFPLFLLIIVRDCLVSYWRKKLKSKNIIVPAIKSAKFKTATQMIGILLILFCFNSKAQEYSLEWKHFIQFCLQNIVMLLSCVFAVISGTKYYFIFKKKK